MLVSLIVEAEVRMCHVERLNKRFDQQYSRGVTSAAGPPRAGFGPDEKISSSPPPPSKGRPAEILYTNSGRLTLSCRMTWSCYDRFNLYSRQIMTIPRKTTTYATQSGLGAPCGTPAPGNFYRLPRPCVGTNYHYSNGLSSGIIS
jgi:hypothetical protein